MTAAKTKTTKRNPANIRAEMERRISEASSSDQSHGSDHAQLFGNVQQLAGKGIVRLGRTTKHAADIVTFHQWNHDRRPALKSQ
jgi:hypothetical protein